ncbi:MAG: 50S ribosomal protein L4 [Sedimentisphaerales bacterium]|nr:50S ribosomal protein L4 [Sedimentisphaerales bacterium]
MIEIPVYNREGKQIDRVQVDESLLGGKIRPALLKQAVVMYHANRRQGTAATRNRGRVAGSTAKLYRQKGTGRARMGAVRTVIRRGGGVAFAKQTRDFRQRMPRKQRRLARDSAVLAKLTGQDALVIDELRFETPKTRDFAAILGNLKIDRSCLVATEQYDVNVYKSLRNLPRVDMLEVTQLNAGDIMRRRKLLFTRAALERLLRPETQAAAPTATDEERG